MAQDGPVPRRPLVRLLLPAAVVAVLVVPGSAAAVEDIQPTASVSITLGGKAKECVEGRCKYRGGRKATVTWTSSCNVPGQDAGPSTEISLMARVKRPGARPVGYETVNVDESGEGASGGANVVIPAGVRLFAQIDVSCSYTTYDADANRVEHTGKTSATSADVFLNPALVSHEFPQNTHCGYARSNPFKVAQVGQFAKLDYELRFSALSLLPSTGLAAELSGIRLHGRGGGLNFKRKPDRNALRKQGVYQVWFRPRRGGTLKIWATIGGVKTNTLRIKVLPKRC